MHSDVEQCLRAERAAEFVDDVVRRVFARRPVAAELRGGEARRGAAQGPRKVADE